MTGITWGGRRLFIQGCAFLLLIIIPLLNFYLNWNFLQGWYQSLGIGDLWIVSPLEGLESILVAREFYGPLLVALILPVCVAIFLGRIFCGWLCPIHFLSRVNELVLSLWPKKIRIKERWPVFRQILFIVLAAELIITCILGAPLFVIFSPPGLVGRELMMVIFFKTLAVEGVVILIVLALNLASRRFFCRYLCPLGGFLALLGFKRKLRVISRQGGCTGCKRCESECPLGLYAGQGEGESLYCWSCGSCIDVCPNDQLHFTLTSRINREG